MLVADLTEDISVGQVGEEPTLSSSEKSSNFKLRRQTVLVRANPRLGRSRVSRVRLLVGVLLCSNAQRNLFSSLSQYHSIYIEIMSILISV